MQELQGEQVLNPVVRPIDIQAICQSIMHSFQQVLEMIQDKVRSAFNVQFVPTFLANPLFVYSIYLRTLQ